jgi:hypothetical protein
MRVFAAGLWANFIDGAGIIGLEKGAGKLLEYPVAVFIQPQVGRLKLPGFEPEVLSHALLVAFGPKRPSSFAAVGAIQAVSFGKNFLVKPMHHAVEVVGCLTF